MALCFGTYLFSNLVLTSFNQISHQFKIKCCTTFQKSFTEKNETKSWNHSSQPTMVLAFLTIRATWVDEKFDPNNFLFPESEEV